MRTGKQVSIDLEKIYNEADKYNKPYPDVAMPKEEARAYIKYYNETHPIEEEEEYE